LYAENTGVVANNMWDPDRRARFSRRDRDTVSDGYWYDGEPIWNTLEKAGRIAACYFWPGSEAPVGGMRPTYFKLYDGSVTHDQRVDQVLAWLDLPAERRPSFLTLYFSAVDSAGHAHGPGHPSTLEAAREVDRALGRLLDGLEQRGLLGRMHILITSDHGMQQIDLDRYVLLDEFIDLDQVHVSDWGPAAQIWTIEGGPTADVLVGALIERHPAFARVWKKGEGPPRYHFDDHKRVPDVTVEAELGWMISNRPYYAGMQRGALNGMHGWDPAWRNMHGILIAHGPAFAAGERLPAVRSVDLYSLMAALLEIAPVRTDGSLTAFQPMLASEAALQPVERHWRCDDRRFMTRSVPGLAALHAGARVFSLPAVEADSGSRFADTGVE
ncbi:MAG: ectonucleotide pyrophosphatase/phosphodiesterase, partial [Wenzhouxiangellaceae bacterium]